MTDPAATTCPNGHTSGDPEWCDTCGAPMGAAAGTTAAAPPSPPMSSAPLSTTVAPVSCPHCAAMNSADNLFCESCGYDFVTGQIPDPIAAPLVEEPPSSQPAPAAGTWVVVIEVDPVWHALKGELADRALPPASTSTVSLTQHASLVGRTSQSRGLRPEVALDTDTAVSRRHAQLILEADKLSVVDLSSTNGTFVLDGGVVPTEASEPLAPGVSAVLDDGDQIFVGAWSRLTVRRV
jgi:hypothetical protein